MALDTEDIRNIFLGRAVVFALGFIAVFWGLLTLLLEWGVIPEQLYGAFYPFWLPVYLAILFASGMRNIYFPWLGNGILFNTVIVAFLYLEAVLLAAVYRVLRQFYRRYKQNRKE